MGSRQRGIVARQSAARTATIGLKRGDFAQEQRGHAGVTYRMRDVIEAPSAQSIPDGGRLRSLSVASWDPGPIPVRSTPGSFPQGRDRV